MPRKKRQNPRKRPKSARQNIRMRVARALRWPWFRNWTVGRFLKIGFLLAFWGAMLLTIAVFILSIGLPDIRKAVDMDHRPTVILRDRGGKEFARMGDTQGDILRIDQISPWLIKAVISIEDRRFYHHWGVDPWGLARAMLANFRHRGMVQGGSTVTQQLAKNLFLSPERTLTRKLKEMLLALYLEHKYSKNEIMAAYLNRAYFGAGAYGVDSAARVYFKTSAKNLTLEQSAMLAGLLKAPSKYSPENDPKLTMNRTRTVLIAMGEAGYIKKGADKVKLHPLPARDYAAGGSAAMHYYADWIMSQVESYIGTPEQNLVIDTAMDNDIQNFASGVVKDTLDRQGAAKNIDQGALITMKPDGEVVAMVGGRDYTSSPYNRAALSTRQPGSSFKLFVYLAALEAGYTPDSIVLDAPIKIGHYTPENFEKEYHGNIRLQDAVALSLNTVAVRTLQDVGISHVKTVAQRLGITDPLSSDLSLALGSSSVHMLNLTAAYATLANRGQSVEPFGIVDIKTMQGEVLYKHHQVPPTPVLDARIVAEMNQMLQAVISYGTGEKAMLDRPAAGKTGTSSDYHDAWFMGYTPDYITGVWVGNDDNAPMKRVTGGMVPAGIWHDVMMAANRGLPVRALLTGYATAPTPVPGEVAPVTQPQPPQGGNVFENLLNSILGTNASPEVPQPTQPSAPSAPDEKSAIRWN